MKTMANKLIKCGLSAISYSIAKRTMGVNKVLTDYSMGYKLTIIYKDVEYVHDTRKYYSGRKRYNPTHPQSVVNISLSELKQGIKIYKEKEKKSKEEYKKRTKIAKEAIKFRHKSILNGTHRPIKSGWIIIGERSSITGLDTINEALLYRDKVKKYVCRYRKEVPKIMYAEVGDRWIIGGYTINRKYYDNRLAQTAKEIEIFLNEIQAKEEPSVYEIKYYILNQKNEEKKRKFSEKLGGWEKILPEIAEPVSSDSDGANPIYLYRIAGINCLLVADTSTGRKYSLFPPNQDTNNAREAWSSTFPVAIFARHGDVGVELIGEENILTFQS